MFVCMYVRSESASVSHSSPPQLKRVRVISACVYARACMLVLFRSSLYCVCLSAGAHRDTNTQETQKTQANTWQVMIGINTCTQAQYLSTQPRETRKLTQAMKARQKRRVAGPTTGCRTTKADCIQEKQRVRQPAVRYAQKEKKSKKFRHTQTHKYACWYV